MAVKVKFKPNRQGIAEIGRSKAMQAMLKDKAEMVKARAEVIAPVETGRYKGITQTYGRGGFHVIVGVSRGKAYAKVRNTTPYASYLEFGTSKMRRQRILGRALLAARGEGVRISVLRIRRGR